MNQLIFHYELMLINRPNKIFNAFQRTGSVKGGLHTNVIRLDSMVSDDSSDSVRVNDIHAVAHELSIQWLDNMIKGK